jgi:hypothetical protein
VVGEGPDLQPSAEARRIYINDKAANDSLNRAVTGEGFVFYAQPKARYNLMVQGSLAAGTQLYLVRLYSGRVKEYPHPIAARPLSGSTGFSFLFSSVSIETNFVWGLLLGSKGEPLSDRVDDVFLAGSGAYNPRQFGINYYYYGSSLGYFGESFKYEIESWHGALAQLFLSYGGIVVKKSGPWHISRGTTGCVSYPLDSYELPALPNAETHFLNVVFTDCIKSGAAQSKVLGFSPREATGLNSRTDNILIMSLMSDNQLIVYTLAHEIGHFFGLRHIVATSKDLEADNDASNRDDGFSDTEFCKLSPQEGGRDILAGSFTRSFCLRRLSATAAGDCSLEAKRNLMFPSAIPGERQGVLSPGQIEFLLANIALLEH